MKTKTDVINTFHSFPLSKYALPDGLENQFFVNALAEYELEIGDLGYDEITQTFNENVHRGAILTLGMLMYINYITRELSRIEKLNGFKGKDISLTGNDASKRITLADLELEIKRVNSLLHKQKNHCFE